MSVEVGTSTGCPRVSVDGSKFKANANKHRSVTYERAGALIAQLEGEITELLGRAEAADVAGEDDPQVLPKEIARREALRDKLDAGPSPSGGAGRGAGGSGAGSLRGQGGGAGEAPGSCQGQASEAADRGRRLRTRRAI